jgi:hypothetical protein
MPITFVGSSYAGYTCGGGALHFTLPVPAGAQVGDLLVWPTGRANKRVDATPVSFGTGVFPEWAHADIWDGSYSGVNFWEGNDGQWHAYMLAFRGFTPTNLGSRFADPNPTGLTTAILPAVSDPDVRLRVQACVSFKSGVHTTDTGTTTGADAAFGPSTYNCVSFGTDYASSVRASYVIGSSAPEIVYTTSPPLVFHHNHVVIERKFGEAAVGLGPLAGWGIRIRA